VLAGEQFHGAYTRASWFLRRMVRETGALTLQDAICRMTSLPARRLGLADPGRIAECRWRLFSADGDALEIQRSVAAAPAFRPALALAPEPVLQARGRPLVWPPPWPPATLQALSCSCSLFGASEVVYVLDTDSLVFQAHLAADVTHWNSQHNPLLVWACQDWLREQHAP